MESLYLIFSETMDKTVIRDGRREQGRVSYQLRQRG
jgi:hypothetical protein